MSKCPLCGKGSVTSRREDVEQSDRGAVTLHFLNCSHCGSDFSGHEESQLNKRAMEARAAISEATGGAQ